MSCKKGHSSDEHHHHHHHSHSGEEVSIRQKLEKLLEHWQHHNEDHARSFETWEKKAREEHLVEVAEFLVEAARLTREINEVLQEALKKIKS